MSQNREPDEDMQEFLARLQREFPPRTLPPEDAPPREASGPPPYMGPRETSGPPPYMGPRRVRLTLPLARPRAVFVLLSVNVLMYGLSLLLASRLSQPSVLDGQLVDSFTAALYRLGAKENAAINAGQWWRLLTPMVLHGSLLHLLFNSWALYALGVEAERVYGTARFLAIYLLAGLAGSIASYTFNPLSLSVGASGAIFGLLGALAAFSYASRALIGWEASKMQLGQMATLAVINLAFGFIPGSNIDNSAHIGGLIVGGLAGLALAPRYFVDRRSYTPTVEQRGSSSLGWGIAAGMLVMLIVLFVVARMAQVG